MAERAELSDHGRRRDVGFRADINGLRAIAVVGVIAFHFKLGPLRAGGFAGVDVFFVVSGFLMTRIITGRLDRSAFLLIDFLLARTRRIVPALVVLVIGVLAAGIVLVNPLRLEALGERAVWSLLFLSNALYAIQGVYFDRPHQNWLLHTWSLSVEWQFYLIFPLALMLLRALKTSWRVETGLLLLVAAGSFVVMMWSLTAGDEALKWNFYMLSSRAWEFLAGGLAAYATPRLVLGSRQNVALHYLGMASIFLAMMVFHNTTPWPSAWTLVPVLGTVAMLVARHETPHWADVAPVRLAGLWSYSIYLWHWPVAAALMTFGHWSLAERLLGVAASVCLGAASYAVVERRATDLLWRERKRLWRFAVPAFAIALTFGFVTKQTVGFETIRFMSNPALLAKLRDFRTARDDWFATEFCDHFGAAGPLLRDCRYGNPKSNDVLVIGDSFAAQISARYHDVFKSAPFGIEFVTRGACIPITKTNYLEYNASCDDWTEAVYSYALRSNFKRVLFFSFWPNYLQGRLCLRTLPNCGNDADRNTYDAALDEGYKRLAGLWRQLRAQGKEVFVFDVVPYPGDDGDPIRLYDQVAAGTLPDSVEISYEAFMKNHAASMRRLREAANESGAILIDPAAALCPGGRCPIVRDGRPLYTNAFHLRTSMMKDARFAFFDRYIVPAEIAQLKTR